MRTSSELPVSVRDRWIHAICGCVCIIFIALALGCERGGAQTSPAGKATAALPSGPDVVVEDFENDRLWSQDSAGNHLDLAAVDEPVSSGHSALAVTVHDNGRDKGIVRKEVAFDLGTATHVVIDAHCDHADPKLRLALAARTDKGTVFECQPQALHAGWNKDLVFVLNEQGLPGKYEQWKAERHQVNRLLIMLFNDSKEDRLVVVDHLRVLPGTGALRQAPIVFSDIEPFPATAKRRETIALRFAIAHDNRNLLAPAKGDAFLRGMTAPWVRLRGPDGQSTDLRGFCTGSESEHGRLVYRYEARFCPDLTGLWEYQIGADSAGQWTWSQPDAFTCLVDSAGAGMIGIDRDDRRYFSYASGDWYYPMGMNIAWAGDYAPYLDRLAAHGGNFARTWICPWNNPLDVNGKFDVINFSSAAAIDRLFAQAEEHRVSIQLVLQYHGALGGDWGRNPFNAANGGPCRDPRDFWIDRTARTRYKKLLDYVVARWAHSPRLFAWELWNEADLTPSWRPIDIVDWHREMADYVKSIDPYHHLVTTSVSSTEELTGLWRLESIDFAQVHQYDRNLDKLERETREFVATLRIPCFIGESGRGGNPADDQVDPDGRHLRHTLWLAWMHGLAGNTMPWWWDTHLEPNRLERHYMPLVKYISGEDLRGSTLRTLRRTLRTDPEIRLDALIGERAAYGYIYAPFSVEQPKAEQLGPLLRAGERIHLTGLCPGTWQLEWWDLQSGNGSASVQVECGSEGADILCPLVLGDRAFKMKRVGAGELDAQLK
jgi:hypothetical protein